MPYHLQAVVRVGGDVGAIYGYVNDDGVLPRFTKRVDLPLMKFATKAAAKAEWRDWLADRPNPPGMRRYLRPEFIQTT